MRKGRALHFTTDVCEGLPGPAWLRRRRLEAFVEFESMPLPSEKEEVWRYSPIDQLDLGAYELAGSTQADGGTPDSGTPDAGNPDGGPGSGPGGPPGGPPSGGIPDGSTGVQGGCTAGPSAAPWAVVLGTLLVVVALRTWRRR